MDIVDVATINLHIAFTIPVVDLQAMPGFNHEHLRSIAHLDDFGTCWLSTSFRFLPFATTLTPSLAVW